MHTMKAYKEAEVQSSIHS